MSKAKRGKTIIIDKAERDAIIKELDTNILVEAGAGSGKTTSLVGRITALIGEGRATISQIAAVTFTKKAAAELKERCQISIEKEFRKSGGRRRELFANALMDMEQGFIGTIHSFCARLLRERPVEAGIDPVFTKMEDEENELLLEEVWDEYSKRAHEYDETAMERLLGLGVSLEDLKKLYKDLSRYPEVDAVKKELPVPDLEDTVRRVRDFLAYALPLVPASAPDNDRDDAQKAIMDADSLARKLDMTAPVEIMKVVARLKKAANVTLNRWPKGIGKGLKETSVMFVVEVLDPAERAWNEYRHYYLVKLAEPAMRQFNEERRRQSRLNFNDLLMLSSRMLRDNPEVRKYFQTRFTHLLVDEFQDTDPVQAEVMLYLTGEDRNEKDWTRLKPAPGSLFVVGDPKQSIYRFRRADIDIYNTVKKIIAASGGINLGLTSNFRSVPSVCEWVNPVFEVAFGKGSRYQAPHAELIGTKDGSNGICGVRKINVPKVDRNKAELVAEEDARLIASWIRKSLDGKGLKVLDGSDEHDKPIVRLPKPSDFMILHTQKDMIALYAKILEDYGIAYEVSGGEAFRNAIGMREVLKVLKAVSEPESSLDLVAALRGLFGISDDILCRFRLSGGRFSIYSSVPDGADADVKEAVAPAYEKLRLYKKWAAVLLPSVAIEKIVDDCGLVAETLSGEAGGSATGAVMKALEYIQGLESNGMAEFNEAVESLDRYIYKSEVDAMDISHKSVDAVRVMNLHKAKGLEATVVFLACPRGAKTHGIDLHIARQDGGPKGYFRIATKYGELGVPPDWDVAAAEEALYAAAEKQRLMYVASTRARQLLVISSYGHYSSAESVWSIFDTYLGNTPELEGIEVLSPRQSLEDVNLTPEECKAAAARFEGMAVAANMPTYALATATGLKDDDKLPNWSKDGKGMGWGRVIHKALEALGKGYERKDIELLIATALKDEGLDQVLKKEAMAVVDSVASSTLWNEVQTSEQKLFEVPFCCKSSAVLVKEGMNYAILSGVIDLAYKTKDEWVIVDYKTDEVGANLDEFVAYYAPQVKAYRKYWEEITGEKVARAGLYFIKKDTLIEVPN
jgi:ATP-dependent helicase/nuclease subunit A